MQVPNVLGGISELFSGAKPAVKPAAIALAATVNGAVPPSSAAAMRQIVSQYDMTDITPNDFSNMIQQLSAKGAVSAKDMQDLSAIRVDLESAGIAPGNSVNLQQFYNARLASAQAEVAQASDPIAAQANVQAIGTRLTWVQRFAAVREGDGSAGLNAVA